jgi:hypothetical protein
MGLAVMREALNVTGRPIVLSARDSSDQYPSTWSPPATANTWQTRFLVEDKWARMMHRVDMSALLWRDARPGYFNDADNLAIGTGGMSTIEYRTHMTMWSVMKSPLIIGCDLASISGTDLKMLTNPEVVSVSQDPLGIQAHRIWSAGAATLTRIVWSGADERATNPSIEIRSCDKSDPLQQWHIAHNGSIVLGSTGECIEQDCSSQVKNKNLSRAVGIGQCGRSFCELNQHWKYQTSSWPEPTRFRIISIVSGQCLTLQPEGRHEVMAAPCTPALQAFQTWLRDDKTEQIVSPISMGDGGHGGAKACLAAPDIVRPGTLEVWAGPLTGGKNVVVLLNRQENATTKMSVKWDQLQWFDKFGAVVSPPPLCQVRDVWAQEDKGLFTSGVAMEVQVHGVVMLVLDPRYSFMKSANWSSAMKKASEHLLELNGSHNDAAFLGCESNSTFNPWAHYVNVSFSVRVRMLLTFWQVAVEPVFLHFIAQKLHIPLSHIHTQSLLRFGNVVGAKYSVLVLHANKRRAIDMLGSTATSELVTRIISKEFCKWFKSHQPIRLYLRFCCFLANSRKVDGDIE